mmetsp:Transcript_94673/g.165346  ORF Transcript_94673/g.165346 Transcript_94673/m.165346 type:complete len:208 (-) Transcript_94673:874-1497(-)
MRFSHGRLLFVLLDNKISNEIYWRHLHTWRHGLTILQARCCRTLLTKPLTVRAPMSGRCLLVLQKTLCARAQIDTHPSRFLRSYDALCQILVDTLHTLLAVQHKSDSRKTSAYCFAHVLASVCIKGFGKTSQNTLCSQQRTISCWFGLSKTPLEIWPVIKGGDQAASAESIQFSCSPLLCFSTAQRSQAITKGGEQQDKRGQSLLPV